VAGTFGLRIAAIGLGFLATFAMARLLGVAAFGVYALVIAWTTLLSTPAMLGFERLLVRELAAFESRDEWTRIRGILRLAQRVVLPLAVALALALAGFGALLGDPHGLGAPLAFALGATIIPLTVFINVRQSALQGLHRVALSFVPETLIRPGLLLLLAGGALLLGVQQPTALLGVSLVVVATAVALVVSVVLLRRHLGARRHGPSEEPQAWLPSALPLAYLATIAVIGAQVDLVLVGILLGPEDAGVYAVAVRGAAMIGIPLTVINATSAPTFARLWARGERARLQRELTLTVRSAVAVTVVVAAAFIVFGGAFLDLFGPGFERGAGPLVVLTVGRVLGTAAGPTGTLLAMTGQERAAALGVTVGVILEIVLVLVLVPLLGVVGAAFASSAGIVFTNGVQNVLVRRRLGLRTNVLGI